MPARRDVDPAQLRSALLAVLEWVDGGGEPDRPVIAAAVRLSARALAHAAPGNTVEVRVPPFVAVQCIAGPRHTRGTPPNVVETDPQTWLRLVTGRLDLATAERSGSVTNSGTRAGEIAHWLPLLQA